MNWKLEGKEEITAEGREFELEYYLTSEKKECWEFPVYGIAIVKREGNTNETETTGGISHSEEVVKEMLKTLRRCTVTPMALLETVDQMVTEKLNSEIK